MHKRGLYGWFDKNLRGKKGQQGFTLIELLVVVTILGILAAIVTLSLVGLTTNASIQSCNQEYKTVQAAIDAYMANNNLDVVSSMGTSTAASTATNNMTTSTAGPGGHPSSSTTSAGPLDLYNAAPSAAKPNYTRNGTTQFYYDWDAAGKIDGIFDSSGADMQPKGCKVT